MLSRFTAKEVAEWMVEQLPSNDVLYQEATAREIRERFGGSFIYIDEDRNVAIKKDVLAVFEKLARNTIIWDQRRRLWRKLEKHSKAEQQQD